MSHGRRPRYVTNDQLVPRRSLCLRHLGHYCLKPQRYQSLGLAFDQLFIVFWPSRPVQSFVLPSIPFWLLFTDIYHSCCRLFQIILRVKRGWGFHWQWSCSSRLTHLNHWHKNLASAINLVDRLSNFCNVFARFLFFLFFFTPLVFPGLLAPLVTVVVQSLQSSTPQRVQDLLLFCSEILDFILHWSSAAICTQALP